MTKYFEAIPSTTVADSEPEYVPGKLVDVPDCELVTTFPPVQNDPDWDRKMEEHRAADRRSEALARAIEFTSAVKEPSRDSVDYQASMLMNTVVRFERYLRDGTV